MLTTGDAVWLLEFRQMLQDLNLHFNDLMPNTQTIDSPLP